MTFEVIAHRNDIIQYLPQRDPFIAIDSLVEATDDSAHTQFLIESTSIFTTDGKISEAGLIENMAQTAAAQMGYVCLQKSMEVPIGYLAGVKNLLVKELPVIGTLLDTYIVVTNRVMGAILLDAEIRVGNEQICQCEIRVFVKQNQGH